MENIREKISMIFDTLICVVSYTFLAVVAFILGKKLMYLAIEEQIVRYYLCGILLIIAIGLSVFNISSYNDRYNRNDSDSSKRQNDFFFEADIRREEGRYSDRRDLE